MPKLKIDADTLDFLVSAWASDLLEAVEYQLDGQQEAVQFRSVVKDAINEFLLAYVEVE